MSDIVNNIKYKHGGGRVQFKGYWKLRIFLSYLGQQVKKKGQKIMIMYLFFNDSNLFRTSYYGNRSLQRTPMFQTSHFFFSH